MASPPRILTAKDLEDLLSRLDGMEYREVRRFFWRRARPRLDRFLYKFASLRPSDSTSIDRVRDVVVRSRLWLSSPLQFNDPFDMSAKIIVDGTLDERRDCLDAMYERRGLNEAERQAEITNKLAMPDQELAKLVRQAYTEVLDGLGVCCFVRSNPRIIPMWSHYASNHEGFCFQFEVARDPRAFMAFLVPMRYSNVYPEVRWTTDPNSGVRAIVETKFDAWAYEEEIRMIVPGGSRQYLNFQPAALRSIIIGCRAASQSIDQMQSVIQERIALGLPAPTLYRAVKHESKFKLVITGAAGRVSDLP